MASDLISRAALLDEFHALCGPQTGDGWDNMGVYNLIVRQKAVDAAPVVHARWIRADLDKDYVTCSYCKAIEKKDRMAWTPEFAKCMNYCLNCGARMDGGEDDG